MKPATQEKSTLYVSMELSDSRWRLAMRGSGGAKVRRRVIQAEDLAGLWREIGVAKTRLGVGAEAPVVSCYEAGRYGFALHRVLTDRGWRNHVVHPSSVRVSRQGRRAKTDRLDADLLLRSLVRYEQGERGEWTVVRVPSVEAEDERELQRELDSLRLAGNRERNQIEGLLLKCLGKKIEVEEVQKRGLARLRTLSDGVVPAHLWSRLERTLARLQVIEEQARAILKARRERLREARRRLEAGERIEPLLAKVLLLESMRCVGEHSAWLLATELFSWRELRNRRQVGRLAGLTGTPYDSGESRREQGIDKAGNRRVRRLMVELSWLWLRYQPESKLTLWFREHFVAVRRHRRVGIVALARKLLIALWRFCEQGVIPEGAVLKL